MELKVIDAKGQVSGSHAASDVLFAREYNESLVHQLIVAYLANARSGNRAQLTRAEVKHSTKKPWRQKGTGRARSGMTSHSESEPQNVSCRYGHHFVSVGSRRAFVCH